MDRDDPFDRAQTDGIDGLQVEYIYEYWGDHFDGSDSYYKDGEDSYDYEQQLAAFKEQLNDFLAEHEVYDVTVEKSADEHGQVRHEAWILYQET